MNEDIIFMRRCLQLATFGLGEVAPNPMVGAVLVNDGRIIGEGYHHSYGEPHAEVNAINAADESRLKTSTLYVNLEPCAHHGKTPPCADLIIEKKIKRVVIGCTDPNPLVSGKGIQKLKDHGIEVELNVCFEECEQLNKRFFTAIKKKRPYIILKFAQTSDGFMGKINEPSGPISNNYSQRLVHKWRSEEGAILIGTRTALLDNPQLNARVYGKKNPVRIIFDRDLSVPVTYHIYDDSQKTIILNSKENKHLKSNVELISIDTNPFTLPGSILTILLERNIQSLLIEGGAGTLESFINKGLWDEARIFTSPVSWGKGIRAPGLGEGAEKEQSIKIMDDSLTIYKNKNMV